MKRKSSRNEVKQNPKQNFFLSAEKKKKILAVLMMVLSVFLFLSIISYNPADEDSLHNIFSDFFNSLSEAADTTNWVGIIGAHFARFFVKDVFGYFSVVFPAIIFLWGLRYLKKIEFRTFIHYTNFLIISAIIISAIFGVLQSSFLLFENIHQLSGSAGLYFGEILSRLLGGAGSIIILFSVYAVILIYAFDIKFEKLYNLIKKFISGLFEKENEKEQPVSPVDQYNLSKIKSLRQDKKKEKISPVVSEKTAEDLMDEEIEETKIRIIRKSDEPMPQEENQVVKEEIKKVDLAKTGDIPAAELPKEEEIKLPNQWEESINYKRPSLEILDPLPQQDYQVAEEELTRNAELLREKLKLFDIEIKDISVTPGPVVTLYEIVPAPGVKISQITGLENDIALALAAKGIRIIAPIPGKGAIGVEIPNKEAAIVNARSVLGKIAETGFELPIAMGKTINGDVYITDLAKMPHLLIAGSTGSGKSVGINMIIGSLLYAKHPSEVKLIMIDPKKIELSFYKKLRKHFLAISPDLDEEIITMPQNAVILLKSVEYEMEKRYDKLAKAGVRNIIDYNLKVSDPKRRPHDTDEVKHHPIPYLIVIVDELADLMITAGKEVEEPITRLAQLARAVGIHLVLATQRPSVNVITGVIKANFSSRIAYQVATKIDSRTILDMNGAEQLLGKGDMLFLPTGSPKPIRIQNAFISTDEVEKVTNYIYSQPGYSKAYYLPSIYEKKKSSNGSFLDDRDPMFEEAAKIIVRTQQGSVSLLQRRLKLGYSRAARIVDQLEEAGIVGPSDGSKARTVLIEDEQQLTTLLRALE
ncbi:MAG: DNA translocase FtsK [Ignavibacteriaceae bacterium]|nr:DNA translocase FtsK [Ignavibacteriaceae bacterium]